MCQPGLEYPKFETDTIIHGGIKGVWDVWSVTLFPGNRRLTWRFCNLFNREFPCKGLASILEVTLNSVQYLLG